MPKVSKQKLLREAGAWGFVLPHLVLFLVFFILALVINTVISFHNWDMLGEKVFKGLGNYTRVFADSRFWKAVMHTLMFAVISIPIVIAFGLGFASLLNSNVYGKLWILICIVAPTFFGSVGVLTTWKWIYASYPSGVANFYLGKLGILDQAISWFETPARAWGCIIFTTVWWIVGFSALIFLGALKRIPKAQYEAAQLDGAGPILQFFHITLPWIRNVLVFEVVRQVLLAFGLFDQVYFFSADGAGGPAGSTRTMVHYLFTTGFRRQDLGRAAAISWYIFAIVLVFALVQLFGLTKSIKNAEE